MADHVATCASWTDEYVVCAPPDGVVAAAVVVVTAASALQSTSRPSDSNVVVYFAPEVAIVSPHRSSTRGGIIMTVSGFWFSDCSPLPSSVWLSKNGAVPSPPWLSSGGLEVNSPASPLSLLRCENVTCGPRPKAAAAAASQLTCTVPAGVGTNWTVVVVNHDVQADGGVSLTDWQRSVVKIAPGTSLIVVSRVSTCQWILSAYVQFGVVDHPF